MIITSPKEILDNSVSNIFSLFESKLLPISFSFAQSNQNPSCLSVISCYDRSTFYDSTQFGPEDNNLKVLALSSIDTENFKKNSCSRSIFPIISFHKKINAIFKDLDYGIGARGLALSTRDLVPSKTCKYSRINGIANINNNFDIEADSRLHLVKLSCLNCFSNSCITKIKFYIDRNNFLTDPTITYGVFFKYGDYRLFSNIDFESYTSPNKKEESFIRSLSSFKQILSDFPTIDPNSIKLQKLSLVTSPAAQIYNKRNDSFNDSESIIEAQWYFDIVLNKYFLYYMFVDFGPQANSVKDTKFSLVF